MSTESNRLLLQFSLQRIIVAVHVRNVFADRLLMRKNEILERPNIGLMMELLYDPWVFSIKFINNGFCLIGGAVVRDNHFEVKRSRLLNEALQTLTNKSLLVIGNDTYRNQNI